MAWPWNCPFFCSTRAMMLAMVGAAADVPPTSPIPDSEVMLPSVVYWQLAATQKT